MGRIASSEVFEAEELLEEVRSWSKEEVEELPKLYQKKAREYQRLLQSGEE
jgi:Tfp pilus assembly protein PilP